MSQLRRSLKPSGIQMLVCLLCVGLFLSGPVPWRIDVTRAVDSLIDATPSTGSSCSDSCEDKALSFLCPSATQELFPDEGSSDRIKDDGKEPLKPMACLCCSSAPNGNTAQKAYLSERTSFRKFQFLQLPAVAACQFVTFYHPKTMPGFLPGSGLSHHLLSHASVVLLI